MKNRRHIIIYTLYTLVFALLLGLCGCSLARKDAGGDHAESRDRLIGCFITTEHIDTGGQRYFTGYYGNLLEPEDMPGVEIGENENYNGRIYAEFVEETLTNESGESYVIWNYEFMGLEGIAYFAPHISKGDESYTTFQTGEGLQKVHNKLTSTDSGDHVELSATLYVPIDNENKLMGDEFVYYMNPVYQSADGRVYLTSGSGYAANITYPGEVMTTKLDEKYSYSVNGETTETVNSVEISCESVYVPRSLTVIEMGSGGQMLCSQSFLPSGLPEDYVPQEGTEYIILETYALDSEGAEVVERCIIAPGTGDEDIYVLVPGGNGFMAMDSAEVLWDEE